MPEAGLTLGPDGAFYGTTAQGGANGNGSIFRITGNSLTTLYSFKNSLEGDTPRGNLVVDGEGNLWGTTASPTIFRITPAGVYTSFGQLTGQNPNGLVYASDGNIYGTMSTGEFFRVTPAGEKTVLHTFDSRGSERIGVPSALVEGADGYFYGTSPISIFKVSKIGEVTTLISVPPNGIVSNIFDGLGSPVTGLVAASDGNFYGVSDGPGGIFRVSPSGDFKRLASFGNTTVCDSASFAYHDNRTALIDGGDGNFYGTVNGCSAYAGTIYQVTPGGVVKVIYRLPGTGLEGSVSSILAVGPDGLYGTTLNQGLGKPVGGGTVFRVTFDGFGGGTTMPGPPPAPRCQSAISSEITAVDPNTSDLRAAVIGQKDWDKNTYQAFADSSSTVTGVAADGVTPVILRWGIPKDGQVIFSLADEGNQADPTGHLGTLGCPNGSKCAPSSPTNFNADIQTLSDGSCTAFIRLTSPVDFVRLGNADDEAVARRPVQIVATLTASDGSTVTQNTVMFITRTPVVLLHGLWSESATWDWDLQADPHFLWCSPNYVTTNASTFGVNAEKPLEGIRCGLDMLHGSGTAGTQVDFVGHSMGGLLGRIYAADFYRTTPLAYRRDDNLQMGDIHKLITLDTPHFGSKLANALVDENGTTTDLGVAVQEAFDLLAALPGGLKKCIDCGAVFDLRVGSPALKNMPAVTVPSHAIVATGGEAALAAGIGVAGPESVLLKVFTDAGANWGFFDNEAHDLIVADSSQAGGLSGTAVSRFGPTPIDFALHFTVTGDDRISLEVVKLLNAPANSGAFGHFQATGP